MTRGENGKKIKGYILYKFPQFNRLSPHSSTYYEYSWLLLILLMIRHHTTAMIKTVLRATRSRLCT